MQNLTKLKQGRENNTQAEKPVNLNQGGQVQQPAMDDPINPDPRAEAWAQRTHGSVQIEQ